MGLAFFKKKKQDAKQKGKQKMRELKKYKAWEMREGDRNPEPINCLGCRKLLKGSHPVYCVSLDLSSQFCSVKCAKINRPGLWKERV